MGWTTTVNYDKSLYDSSFVEKVGNTTYIKDELPDTSSKTISTTATDTSNEFNNNIGDSVISDASKDAKLTTDKNPDIQLDGGFPIVKFPGINRPNNVVLILNVYELNSLIKDTLNKLSETFSSISESIMNGSAPEASAAKGAAASATDLVSQLKGYLTKDGGRAVKDTDFTELSKIKGQIFIPVPNGFSESYSHSLQSSSYNIVEKAVEKVVSTLNGVSSIAGVIQDYVKAVADRSNILFDPKLLNVYTGTTPRSFNIDFMIIPRNQAEAEAIREAYLWLKKWSSGKQGNNQIMLEGPHVFTMNWVYCKSDGTYDDKTPLMHMLKTGSGSSNRNGKVVKTFFVPANYEEEIVFRTGDELRELGLGVATASQGSVTSNKPYTPPSQQYAEDNKDYSKEL